LSDRPAARSSTAEGARASTNSGFDNDNFEIISQASVIAFMPCVTIAWRNHIETADDRMRSAAGSGQHDAPEPKVARGVNAVRGLFRRWGH
jgi:hypothetical protein